MSFSCELSTHEIVLWILRDRHVLIEGLLRLSTVGRWFEFGSDQAQCSAFPMSTSASVSIWESTTVVSSAEEVSVVVSVVAIKLVRIQELRDRGQNFQKMPVSYFLLLAFLTSQSIISAHHLCSCPHILKGIARTSREF